MSEKDTSEPAFPFACQGPTTGPEFYYGLSMRDYFAAKAVQGFIASPQFTAWSSTMYAEEAYAIADAMLQERAK